MNKESDLREGSDVLEFFRGQAPASREVRVVEKQEWLRLLLTEQMRKARRAAGMTQAQVAEKLGVTQGWVSRLEHADHDHALESIVAYLDAVGADLEFVIHTSAKRPQAESSCVPQA